MISIDSIDEKSSALMSYQNSNYLENNESFINSNFWILLQSMDFLKEKEFIHNSKRRMVLCFSWLIF